MADNLQTLNTDELQRKVAEYQSGIQSNPENPPVAPRMQPAVPEEPAPFLGDSYEDVFRRTPLSSYVSQDYTEEARQAGYGTSRYDNAGYYSGMDLEDNRAKSQSAFVKIGSGIAKGGVIAATTAVNTSLGTVFGLGSALFELATDSNGNGRSLMDTIDAGTNNWLSTQLVKLQNASENILPNYRTAEERSEQYQREWYKHMGTANFIGDELLKNFGFTVGAMLGGAGWARLIGAGLSKQLAGNIMKGAVAAAEGDAEAAALMKEAAQLVSEGKALSAGKAMKKAVDRASRLKEAATAGINTEKVVSNVTEAAKAMGKYGAKLGLYGSIIGAMGEGTVEGIMAKDEFLNEYRPKLDRQFAREYENIERDLLASGNYSWVTFVQQQGPGETINYVPRLTPEGEKELMRRQQEATAKYQEIIQKAEEEGDRVASATYLFNLPILTISNVVQFGRLMSGGWTTAKNAAAAGVKGGLRTEMAEQGAKKITADYASKFGKGSVLGKTVLGSLKMAGTEAGEELSQGAVSSGAKQVAEARLSAFNDAGYDAEAIDSVRSWFEGASAYLGDIKNWKEGALGAFTGLFGIPGRRWSGGVAEAYREARDEVNASRDAANTLNGMVNSKDFQDRWNNYIRHLAFDNEMEEALLKNDRYSWKSANDAQLINDIMMFADAGKLDDLYSLVNDFGQITEVQAGEILDMSKGEDGELPAYLKSKSKADMVESVKKQAGTIKDKIDQYRSFYSALSERIPIGTPKDQRDRLLKEMTFTAQQIKAFEDRYLTLLDETEEALTPVVNAEKEAFRDPLKALIRRAFSGGFPILFERKEELAAEAALLDDLEKDVAATKDEALITKVSDMRKLSEDRRAFYRKLLTLQTEEGQKEHAKQAVTQEKINQAAEEAVSREETKSYSTVEDVRKAYNAAAKNKKEFVEDLRKKKGANQAVDDFVSLYDSYMGFRTKAMAAKQAFLDSMENKQPWVGTVYQYMVLDLLRHNVNSIEDLQKLDPEAFATSSEMLDTVLGSNSFMAPKEGAVAQVMGEIQKHLRDVMDEFLKERNSARIAKSSKKISSSKKASTGTKNLPGLETVGLGKKKAPPAQTPTPAPASTPAPAPEPAPETFPEEYDRERERADAGKEGRGVDTPPTERELFDDAVPPIEEPKELVKAAGKTDGKFRYVNTAIPEVAVKRLEKRRAAYEIEDYEERKEALEDKEAQLVEFSEDPTVPKDSAAEGDVNNFSKIARALKKRGAYDNMSLVRKGDHIKFVIYQNEDVETGGFPKIMGDYVILMCVEKTVDGEKKLLVLNSLRSGSSKFFGLESLNEAIRAEFSEKKFDENGMFVFSKTAPVWAIRSGFMEYGPLKDERPITRIPGYDKRAPIIFINADGSINYMINEPKGTKTDRKFDVTQLFPNRDIKELRGHFYYLAYDNDGYKVPIRLFQKHFSTKTLASSDATTAPFVRVREIVKQIITTAKNAEQNVPSPEPVPGESVEQRKARIKEHNTKLDFYRKELSGHLKELDEVLDLHNDAITLGFKASDGRLSLKITPDAFRGLQDEERKSKQTGRSARYYAGDDLTEESFLKGLASLDRAFNVSARDRGDFVRKVADGILTSNAKKARLVGIDFYTFPWWQAEKAFKKGSKVQEQIQKSAYEEEKAPETKETVSAQEESHPFSEDFEFQISGTRPSAVSPETRAQIEAARKESKKRRSRVKSELYNMLQKGNAVSNMRMSDKKLRDKLRRLGMSAPVVEFLVTGLQQHPELRDRTPYEAFVALDTMMRYDIADEYNRSLGEKLDSRLNEFLINFLSKYNIEVREEDLDKMFGIDGVSGAYDVIEKIIWLTKNPDKQNKITLPEEFAHAFVELMGSSTNYGADSADFQFLYETVADTKIYEQVYEKYKDVYKDEDGKPDDYRIRKEAIGQALATAIVHNWEQETDKKDGSFFQRLKEWFQKILDLFKGANITFEQTIDDIAKEILAGDTRRLDKIDDSGYNVLDYEQTLVNQTEQDGGKALDFMRYFSSIGNVITGSLAYRKQGTVYRSKLDSLHDIDMIVPAEVHGIHNVKLLEKYNFNTRNNPEFVAEVLSTPYFKKIAAKYPKMVFANVYNNGVYLTANAVYSEDEALSHRFAQMSGSYASRLEQFTEEERKQLYLFDFFIRVPEDRDVFIDEENGLTLVDYKTPMREKLRMGRAKDIYDYQRWQLFDAFQERRPDPRDTLFQITSVDYGEEAVKQHGQAVYEEVSSADGIFEEDRDNIAVALTVASSRGPQVVEDTRLALEDWSRSDSLLSEDMEDFMTVFNSIFTDTEKYDIAEAMSSAYGVPADQVDMFQLVQDYTLWKLSGILQKGTESDKATLEKAFARLQSLETSHSEASRLLRRSSSIVGERHNRGEGVQLGMVPDVHVFSSLSDETKQGLLARHWTEESYNDAPAEIQDKALRCVGV